MSFLPFTNDLYSWMYEDDIIKLLTTRFANAGYLWNPKTFEIVRLPYRLGDYKSYLPIEDARKVLSKSDGTAEDETKKLIEYFWRIGPTLSQTEITTAQCSHSWTTVILFNVVSERCVYCDIKKPG